MLPRSVGSPTGTWGTFTLLSAVPELENCPGCVFVEDLIMAPGFVGVRDTKPGAASPILACTGAEWAAFLAGVENHEFDR